ncbi:MAG: hypothetical protein ABL872_08520 [Lacibacter sp.]
MQKTVLFLALLFSLQLHAQKIEGVWEGTLFLNGNAKTTMKIRMEIVERDSSNYFGILYSRGIEKNTIYGCDYFISGTKERNTVNFKWQNVQRAVAMEKYECRMFELLKLGYRKKDSVQRLLGSWVWKDEREDLINFTKVSDDISDMGQDEISGYVNDMYEEYESSGVVLAVEDRLPKKILELPVDSSDVIVEFTTIDSSMHDSISVYINGNVIAKEQNLARKPLRLRLKGMGPGTNDLLVVSASLVQPKLNIQMKIIYGGDLNNYTIQPGFASNSLVLFNRKE